MKASDPPIRWTARLTRLGTRLPVRAKLVGGLAQGTMSAAAALIAYIPTKPLGLQEGFWGSITALAVVQSDFSATQTSARDQFAGAAIGGSISALLLTFVGQGLVTYALAVVIAAVACWSFNVSSAARLSGSTATIILLVPHHATGWIMMLSRTAEVAWGVTVAVCIVWLVNRVERAWNPDGGKEAVR